MQIILGSSSPFRLELMQRLKLIFTVCAPDIDESPLSHEDAYALVKRLSIAKAKKVAEKYPQALIIGSDQVAILNHLIVGKPGSHAVAVEQLKQCSGKKIEFRTGLCLFNAATGRIQFDAVSCYVEYKTLSASMIENYLQKDQPYQCAGSIRFCEHNSAVVNNRCPIRERPGG